MYGRILPVFAILATALSVMACEFSIQGLGGLSETVRGSGNLIEESRQVSGISGVEFAMPGNLTIEMGSTESLRIEAEDNLMAYIETDVRAGTLVIETTSGINLQSTRPMNFYLTLTGLDTLAISSSGSVEAPDMQAERFSIRVSSSGDLSMGDLECTSLQVDISSSGDVTMGTLSAERAEIRLSSSGNLEIADGAMQEQDITLSSSGAYQARDVQSVTAHVSLSSSGSATIRVRDSLSGRLSSSGSVYYIGSPQVNVSATSSGSAEQIGD
jgi:hypothetical protein